MINIVIDCFLFFYEFAEYGYWSYFLSIYMEKIIMFKTVSKTVLVSKTDAVSKSHLIAANYVCL